MSRKLATVGVAFALVLGLAGGAAAGLDWGRTRDALLRSQSPSYFGVGQPLARSSSEQITQGQAQADPTAPGRKRLQLQAGGVSSGTASG